MPHAARRVRLPSGHGGLKNQRAAAARLAARFSFRFSSSPVPVRPSVASGLFPFAFNRTTPRPLWSLLKKSTLAQKIQQVAPVVTEWLHFAFRLSSLIPRRADV
jgi:hypothetical protein